MLDVILEVLKDMKWFGLIIGIAIEAISLPFPAALVVLIYGYLLNPSLPEMVMLAFVSSLIYVAFSFIPYWLSIKYESKIRKKLSKNKMRTAEHWVEKYGEWMIAFGRVIGMGYIAYIAGFSKIGPVAFGFYTFLGFFPLSFLMFFLGSLGHLEKISKWFQHTQWLLYSLIGITIVGYLTYHKCRRKE